MNGRTANGYDLRNLIDLRAAINELPQLIAVVQSVTSTDPFTFYACVKLDDLQRLIEEAESA